MIKRTVSEIWRNFSPQQQQQQQQEEQEQEQEQQLLAVLDLLIAGKNNVLRVLIRHKIYQHELIFLNQLVGEKNNKIQV